MIFRPVVVGSGQWKTERDAKMIFDDLGLREALAAVHEVREFGTTKYLHRFGWDVIPPVVHMAAALGHVAAHLRGNVRDEESGLPSLAHAIVRLLFALQLEEKPAAWTKKNAAY